MVLLLSGCSTDSSGLNSGTALRSKLLQASECSFTAEITADYDDRSFLFTADCATDNSGDLSFTLTAPTTISGISGRLTGEAGQLVFDDMTLDFPLSAEDLPSPLSAPWIFMNALRSGFLSSVCIDDSKLRLCIDDTYAGEDIRLDVWLDSAYLPCRAEILHDGIRFLTLNVTKFVIS